MQRLFTNLSTKIKFNMKPITVYLAGTPNGWKASIAFEELGIPYTPRPIEFSKREQKEEWYLKINPNGKIPAIVDPNRNDFAVFESGAIMLYLSEHYDPNHILMPADPDDRSRVIQWLFWQVGGLGPMQGQANHFVKYAPEKVPYGIERYSNETLRLWGVLEHALSDGRQYIAGNFYSAADIAIFGFMSIYQHSGLSLDEFPHLHKWLRRVGARPAVQRGTQIPEPNDLIANDFNLSEEDKKEVKYPLSSLK